MGKKTGCNDYLVRISLFLANIIFIPIGGLIFAVAAVLKWSYILNDVLRNIRENFNVPLAEVQKFIDISLTSFLVLGAFIVFVGFGGLFGSCSTNRFLLTFNIFLISWVLGFHFTVFIYGIIMKGNIVNIANELKTNVTDQINILKDKIILADKNNKTLEWADPCLDHWRISLKFKCCDFDINSKIGEKCCASSSHKQNCVEGVFGYLNINFGLVYILPNVIFLVLEIIILLKKVHNYKKKRQNSFLKSSYDMPVITTTEQK
jgi:hypothetical protein